LAVLFLVMGATALWIGNKYARALTSSGSQAAVDREYLKPPADAAQPWLEEFTLTERSGKPISSRELAGKVYVTSFFFSACPASCLQQNQTIRTIEQQYGPKGVKFVSITCDPEIDTPARLREYADKLGAGKDDWLFLTGELTYTRRIAGEIFRIPMDKQTHSERLFVTDKWGNLRGNFAWNKLDEVTALKLELDKLLAETAPPEEVPGSGQKPAEHPAEPNK
jgi:cytochrome oxidase Cu insertion factor (SCO1/SenC/PrrC family)